MPKDYLAPIKIKKLLPNFEDLLPVQWGKKLLIYQEGEAELPDLTDIKLCIIGIEEDRTHEIGSKIAPNVVRKALYQLYSWQPKFAVADLGNIKAGNTQKDTYLAVEATVAWLLTKNIIPILIGGTHDLTYPQFLGHLKTDQKDINVAVFDETVDLFDEGSKSDPNATFLYQILNQEASLSNFSLTGFQRHLTAPSMIHTLEKLHFECHSLGEVRNNIKEIEPIVRHAHLLSFDMSAVRRADAPAVARATPNGFWAEEACRILRYAGMSDYIRSVGLYEFAPEYDGDTSQPTAQLLAQMIWYFVDGVYARKHDLPELGEEQFTEYIVHLADHELVFLKSQKTDRWWLKIPKEDYTQAAPKSSTFQLVPCSYSDYQTACQSDIPERWMKAYLRIN